MVCGSIGYGDINIIIQMQQFLRENGFNIIDQLSENNNYSKVEDFREEFELSHKIASHDLSIIEKSDIIVVVYTSPSSGIGIEMYKAHEMNKLVILFAISNIKSPWLIYLSDVIVSSKENLLSELKLRI
ncbi:MAG: 2'-deoxynucleoside 5'-phosphate N-hydrolase 1 [Candidatus Anoxychlamydiales bacterium]|uniref:2'-deoxynucleoside 5'-phosphate N-hydrolase 1 n=1 Tax=marine sediment metagenome TaxID=412755 RepID=A0A0F9IMN0_9ZZZZ|nr:2'-deoxynucleoside 5'-phosphate N-hydrolase 1 [Candidatus Anoxychlamydiales bacterium]